MVNLYDSPAQAKFINTYVPIQFEHLYKLSEKREADIEKGYEYLDKANAIASPLGSMSEADNKMYNEVVVAPIRQFIDANVKDANSLADPRLRGQLRSMISRASSNPGVKNALESKEMYKQYYKEMDPRWGAEGLADIKEYNSFTNGVFMKKPYEWFDIEAEGTKLLKGIGKEVLKGSSPDDWNIHMGVSDNKIADAATGYASTGISDPSKLAWARKGIKNAIANNSLPGEYYKLDENGNRVGLVENAEAMFLANSLYDVARKGNEEELVYDRRRESLYNTANEWMMLRSKQAHDRAMQEDDQAEKRKGEKGALDIIGTITNEANDIYGTSTVNGAISSVEKMIEAKEKREVLVNKFGTAVVLAAEMSMKRNTLDKELIQLKSNLSRAQAAGGEGVANAKQITYLSSVISKKEKELETATTNMNNAIKSASPIIMSNAKALNAKLQSTGRVHTMEHTINGRRYVFLNAADLEANSTSPIPSSIGNGYAALNLGQKTKWTPKSTGTQKEAVILTNSSGLSMVHQATNAKGLIRNVSDINDKKGAIKVEMERESVSRSVNTINEALQSGKFNGKAIAESTGKVRASDGGIKGQYIVYVPEDELQQVLGANNPVGYKAGASQAINDLINSGYAIRETQQQEKGFMSKASDIKMIGIYTNADMNNSQFVNTMLTNELKLDK